MERGPVALFGAIVAVGLGPALWLGAQFGRFDAAPPRSSVSVDQTHADNTQLLGGSGAGATETGDDNNAPIRTTPRAHVLPLTTSPSASPSSSHAIPSASASDHSSGPGPSDHPSASPSQSTAPSDGSGDGDDSVPPSPPTDGGSGGSGGGNGDGGSGGGGSGGGSGTGSGTGGTGDDSPSAAHFGQL
jgi:hypothetical protein